MAGHASIYISDPTLLGSRLFSKFDNICSIESLSEEDKATGIKFKFDIGTVTMNFMPNELVREHLNGFSGYCETQLENNEEDLIYVLSRISRVNLVMGCVIEPGFDDDNILMDFIYALSIELNGLLFVFNSVYDFDGDCLLGPMKE